MARFKTIPLKSIFVGERARPVDQDYATAIAASMSERGLINPITVRSTPAMNGGKTPYTLIAGGHRVKAAEINEWEKIDAIIVTADAAEGQLIELSENLFRNELSALDRGLFVAKFREIHEEKYGKITAGGDQKSNSHRGNLIFSPGKELSERVQERLGIGNTSYYRALQIGQKLHPSLRQAVRGTDAENDQKTLLKLASMPDAEQAGIAAALKHEPDLQKVLDMDKPAAPSPDPDKATWDTLATAWAKASNRIREEFLQHIGAAPISRKAA